MPFTEEEKREWLEAKRAREREPTPIYRSAPVDVCVNCHNPFGVNEGVVTEDVAICDLCLGD